MKKDLDLTSYEKLVLEEYIASLPECEREKAKENALARLSEGEPIAYIVKKQYFYDMHFYVTPDTLIPRPDTEHVVDLAIRKIKKNGRFADLCTGSGCIALTILNSRKDLVSTAVDISEKALDVAKHNAKYWSLGDRICFEKLDILSDAPPSGLFDAIISNPPYIKGSVVDEYPSLSYEPRIALDAGEDDMIFYKTIIEKYRNSLCPDAFFLFEIGYDQGEKIKTLALEGGYACEVYKDFSHNDRVAYLTPIGEDKKEIIT